MYKAKEILNRHTKSMNCNSWLKRAPFLEQAVLNAINEALNIADVVGRSEQFYCQPYATGDKPNRCGRQCYECKTEPKQ